MHQRKYNYLVYDARLPRRERERERDVLGSALLWKEARDKVGDE